MMHRFRILIFWTVFLALFPSESGANNVVIFTNTTALPGELVTIDVIIENDFPLGALFVPFRWSTDDLEFVGIEYEESRMSGIMQTIRTDVNPVTRTSAIFITASFTPGEIGWIPIGRDPIAYLTFRVTNDAPDQVAFCDSALEQSNGTIILQVQFTDFEGTQTIFPGTVPGQITIGIPEPAELVVSPAEIFLQGHTDGDDALAGLNLNSNSSTQLDWSLTWQSSWLIASPSIGKTPAVPTIGASLFGLDAGTYYDTVTVHSENAVNTSVSVPVTLVVDTALTIPDDVPFVLMQNRPNPFVAYHDTHTEINYVLEESAHVTIEIFNSIGQPVRRLISRSDSAGSYAITWNGHDLNGRHVPSGHYFYRMTTAKGSITKRMIIIK